MCVSRCPHSLAGCSLQPTIPASSVLAATMGTGLPHVTDERGAPWFTGGPLCLLASLCTLVHHVLMCHGPALPGLPSALGFEVRKPRPGLCPSESQVVPASRFHMNL